MSAESLRYRLTVGCECGGVRLPVLQTAGVWRDAASALNAACDIVGQRLVSAEQALRERGVLTAPVSAISWTSIKSLPVAGVSIDRIVVGVDGTPASVDATFPGLHLNASHATELPSIGGRRRNVTRIWAPAPVPAHS